MARLVTLANLKSIKRAKTLTRIAKQGRAQLELKSANQQLATILLMLVMMFMPNFGSYLNYWKRVDLDSEDLMWIRVTESQDTF